MSAARATPLPRQSQHELTPRAPSPHLTSLTLVGVMIDAGSTGTRCFIYAWPSRHGRDRLPLVERTHKIGITPGLASLAHRTGGTGTSAATDKMAEYLEPITRFLLEHVPAAERRHTPIQLYATAGMRMLDRKEADWVLTLAGTVLSAAGLAVDRANLQVRQKNKTKLRHRG